MPASIKKQSAYAAFEHHAARAEMLAQRSQAVREPLEFVAALCLTQAAVAASIDSAHQERPLTGRLAEDVDRVLPLVEPIVRVAAERGPEVLSVEAGRRQRDEVSVARTRLLAMWVGETTSRDDYLTRALLRPYTEVLRAFGVAPDRLHREGHCPFCGGAPSIGARKPMPDSEGALRMFSCALCGCEWNYGRGSCPSCFEADSQKLPVFSSDAHPDVRIEACDTCRHYMKSIDLTQDAHLDPEIDEIVSLSMDLWAAEKGYTRIEPGLVGI